MQNLLDFEPPANAAGRKEGLRRKDAALELHRCRRSSIVRQAQRALLEILLRQGTATMDNVRAIIDLPEGIDPKCFGAAPRPLARAGIIRKAGSRKTTRPCAHAREVFIWELVSRTLADEWLQDNPDNSKPTGVTARPTVIDGKASVHPVPLSQ